MPSGFKASGIKAGLKSSGKLDLALLLAPEGAVCAGTFTQSLVRAACVDLCIDRLKANAGSARAVLINSGQANACTGELGFKDSVCATNSLAQKLGLMVDEVLICSTGVIGEAIPLKKLISGLDLLIEELSDTESNLIITPPLNYNGLATITITASEEEGELSVSQIFNLDILPVNDAPSLDTISNQNQKNLIIIALLQVSLVIQWEGVEQFNAL